MFDDNFLLTTPTAERLFFDYAKDCPIIDYHNHLNPKDLYERRIFENITRLWLEGDHYKWRAMRCNRVMEEYITGNSSDYDKFLSYASIMPNLIGNPLYHWSHMELKRYFGINTILSSNTAKEIWNTTKEMLLSLGFDSGSLIEKMNVKVLCTTDAPSSDLIWHSKIKGENNLTFKVVPGFRPDNFLNIDSDSWRDIILFHNIKDFNGLLEALSKWLDKFEKLGCKMADHGFIHFRYKRGNPQNIFNKAINKISISNEEVAIFQGEILAFLAREYTKRNMVMQLHLGPIRNNSPKLMKSFGADAGCDSMGEATNPFTLSKFLYDLENTDSLPRTILYGLNPCDNEMLATMAVNYSSNGGQVCYGAAWWLQDHIRGIEYQLNLLMETGSLYTSFGMLTDSRSVTSFVRHEYFRRILCKRIGELVESGEYPRDIEFLGRLIHRVCYKNAMDLFSVC